MMYLLFFIAICFLVIGHFLRMLRWNLLLQIYERPDSASLYLSLSIGYVVNSFIPFRIGDIVRAVISGRKLKNGTSFSLSTIIIEHLIDIPVVCLVFLMIVTSSQGDTAVSDTAIVYVILSVIIFILSVFAIRFNALIKTTASSICSIFNNKIKYGLLFFLWGIITSFKDVLYKISKMKLLIYTVCMWAIYSFSFYCLAQAIVFVNTEVNFAYIFGLIFSQGGFNIIAITNYFDFHLLFNSVSMIVTAYILASLFLMLIISVLMRRRIRQTDDYSEINSEKVQNLLPWVNEKDRLNFFNSYFSTDHLEYLSKYLSLNRDIHILQDCSKGSNATTILCMNQTEVFYRKYALGIDGNTLNEQLKWIHTNKSALPLPTIINELYNEEYCIYDMKYHPTAVELFNYLHSDSGELGWRVLEEAIDFLRINLHERKLYTADKELLSHYIKEKVENNIEKIESAKVLMPLLKYDTLIINGEVYSNLKQLKKWLDSSFLEQVFQEDMCSDIHGDFTIENIIYYESESENPFYYIDPSVNNLHNTPYLDYAKLLQSLHGGYEFLMRTENYSVTNNKIQFIASKSKCYADVYTRYHDYLKKYFQPAQIRSIYFHEIVHWLRLMPYKIKKDSTRAVLFYAGLIIIFNDIVKWYGGEKGNEE